MAKVLCFRGNLIQIEFVAAHLALLQDVAERQSTKAREQGFRLQLKQDMEKHASFTHKIVSGKSAPVRLPVDALRDLEGEASKWSQVWRNAPETDIEELLQGVGEYRQVASDDFFLYV